jgi:hypothetical protein
MPDGGKPFRGSSKGLFYSSDSILNLVLYLCAKFGALDPRINEIRSRKDRSRLIPEVCTRRFSIPTIFGLSDLVSIFTTRASETIMDSSLHISSQS